MLLEALPSLDLWGTGDRTRAFRSSNGRSLPCLVQGEDSQVQDYGMGAGSPRDHVWGHSCPSRPLSWLLVPAGWRLPD